MTAPTMLRRHGSILPSGKGVVLRSFDHPARAGRSLFPSRVFDTDEVKRVLKSGHESRKIGAFVTKGPRRGWPIFTLTLEERATCPRTCLHWLDCYGNNMQAAERITAGSDLESALEQELRALDAKHEAGFLVRLHVLGDFYSTGYVEFWQRMVEELPALHVFGFTAHHPDSEIGRAVAIATFDLGWRRFAIRVSGAQGDMRAARAVGPGEIDADATLCPAQTGATECCATCALCWQSERTIAFGRH